MIDYNVIASSSKGNAVVINKNILIDCGVSWKALNNVYHELQLVLLTHWHGDHFNRTTIKRLAKERPLLRFGCMDYLVSRLIECGVLIKNIDVLKPDQRVSYSFTLSVCPFLLKHDVPNCGYSLYIHDNETGGPAGVFYATDCNNLDGITAKGYSLYLIEANYSEDEIVERIRGKEETGEHVYEWGVLNNHLSREKAENWLYQNMDQHSRYVFLHEHAGNAN